VSRYRGFADELKKIAMQKEAIFLDAARAYQRMPNFNDEIPSTPDIRGDNLSLFENSARNKLRKAPRKLKEVLDTTGLIRRMAPEQTDSVPVPGNTKKFNQPQGVKRFPLKMGPSVAGAATSGSSMQLPSPNMPTAAHEAGHVVDKAKGMSMGDRGGLFGHLFGIPRKAGRSMVPSETSATGQAFQATGGSGQLGTATGTYLHPAHDFGDSRLRRGFHAAADSVHGPELQELARARMKAFNAQEAAERWSNPDKFDWRGLSREVHDKQVEAYKARQAAIETQRKGLKWDDPMRTKLHKEYMANEYPSFIGHEDPRFAALVPPERQAAYKRMMSGKNLENLAKSRIERFNESESLLRNPVLNPTLLDHLDPKTQKNLGRWRRAGESVLNKGTNSDAGTKALHTIDSAIAANRARGPLRVNMPGRPIPLPLPGGGLKPPSSLMSTGPKLLSAAKAAPGRFGGFPRVPGIRL
jgi:hypothetical protein